MIEQNDEKTTKMQNHGKRQIYVVKRAIGSTKKNALTSTGLVLVLYRDETIF